LSGIFSSIESGRLLFVATQCPAIHQADDLLLIYTDGITEATNRAGEEFRPAPLDSCLQPADDHEGKIVGLFASGVLLDCGKNRFEGGLGGLAAQLAEQRREPLVAGITPR